MQTNRSIPSAGLTALSDPELQGRIAGGDEQALAELIRRYWKDCYSLAITYLGRAELAEETVQDIFTRLWLNRSTLPEIERLKDYVYIVTRNHVFKALKKAINREPVQLGLEPYQATGSEDDSVVHHIELKEIQTQIDKAIALLPEKRREIFRLSRQEGLTHGQIAERMQIKKSTVNDHLTLALNFIRSYLMAHRNSELVFIVMILLEQKIS